MKSLLTLIATISLIGVIVPTTINNHLLTPATPKKVETNLTWKFTKTNKDIQSIIHWNNTSSIFKEQKTNKLFFINPKGEIKDTNLYNNYPNPYGFATTINDNYTIIIGGKTVNSPFQFFLVNKDHKIINLNAFNVLKNVKIHDVQVLDSTHVIITDVYHNSFLLTINNNDKVYIRFLNTTTLSVKKISNTLLAIVTIKETASGPSDITIIYDMVINKQIQEFDNIIANYILMFNDQKGVLTTTDLKTYWLTNNSNHVTLKLLDFKSVSIDFLNSTTIITNNGDSTTLSHQINIDIDGSFSILKHSGRFAFCSDNFGIIFNYSESYLISQNCATHKLIYIKIKINNLPLEYDSITPVVMVNTNYLMFSAFTNNKNTSYIIDKFGNNIENFPPNYIDLGIINNNTTIVLNTLTHESDFLVTY